MPRPKRKTEVDTKDRPYVGNYPPLQEWLDKHGASCQWQVPMQAQPEDADSDWYPTAYVECWLVNQRPVVLVIHAHRGGWQIYSALDSQLCAESFVDAEQRVGLK